MRKILGLIALASCGGPAAVATAPVTSPVAYQVWEVSSDDSGCIAVQVCYGELTSPCDPSAVPDGAIEVFHPYPCLAGRPKVRIGQLADSRRCVILPAGVEEVMCPASESAWYPGEGARDEHDPAGPVTAEYSVTAERNMEKGQDALRAGHLIVANDYFTFVLSRFPRSRFAHAAELGMLRAEAGLAKAAGRPAGEGHDRACLFAAHHPTLPEVTGGDVRCDGPPVPLAVHQHELELVEMAVEAARVGGWFDDVDTKNGYCRFIDHHPTFPLVANGDIACRINTMQGRPCDPTQVTGFGC